MIFLKNEDEIGLMREASIILAKVFGVVAGAIKPGIKLKEVDKIAEVYIRDQGAAPSFKGYEGFPASTCLSVNEAIAHGIPDAYELRDGDIVSVDCGVHYKGFHSDSAYTFAVGQITKEAKNLIRVTKEALYLGIVQAVTGSTVGNISSVIQAHVSQYGYTTVRVLAGHGIGRSLHEDPSIPNYGKKGRGYPLKKGMVIAIEPMVNQGASAVRHAKDGWKIVTADGKLSAHFEHTVAIREQKAEILTSYEYIEKALKV
jgi:methionyl aminopeptidase